MGAPGRSSTCSHQCCQVSQTWQHLWEPLEGAVHAHTNAAKSGRLSSHAIEELSMSQYLLEMAGNNSVGDQLIDLNTNFCVIPSLWMHRFFASITSQLLK